MCNCYNEMNRHLKADNTRLVMTMAFVGDTLHGYPTIATERIRVLRDGKAPSVVMASYCPFCGEKYELPEMGPPVAG